ncbi:unnamed protein product [Amoebophrya sp. A120]|nr:unnamed protein product [Amoebophrya sp. A120]|eukprot:GSA120T00025459001.1
MKIIELPADDERRNLFRQGVSLPPTFVAAKNQLEQLLWDLHDYTHRFLVTLKHHLAFCTHALNGINPAQHAVVGDEMSLNFDSSSTSLEHTRNGELRDSCVLLAAFSERAEYVLGRRVQDHCRNGFFDLSVGEYWFGFVVNNRMQNKNQAESTTREESTSHPLRRQPGVNPLVLFQFEVENLRRQLTEAVQYAEQVVDTVYTNYVKSTTTTPTGVDGRNEAAEMNFWANVHLEDHDHRGPPEQQPDDSAKEIQEDQTSVRTPPEPHRQLLGHVYASNNQEIKPVYYHPLEQEVAHPRYNIIPSRPTMVVSPNNDDLQHGGSTTENKSGQEQAAEGHFRSCLLVLAYQKFALHKVTVTRTFFMPGNKSISVVDGEHSTLTKQEGASVSVADGSPTTSRRHDIDADDAPPADKSSATEISTPAAASTTDVSHYFFLRPYVGSTVTKWKIIVNFLTVKQRANNYQLPVLRKKVFDVGANAGLYTLTAVLYGKAEQAVGFEKDTKFHRNVYPELEKMMGLEAAPSSSTTKTPAGKNTKKTKIISFLHDQSLFLHGASENANRYDTVFALASMHWLFACTEYHAKMDTLIGLYTAFAKVDGALLIEWIPLAEAAALQGRGEERMESDAEDSHLQYEQVFRTNKLHVVPADLYEEYSFSKFYRALQRRFRQVRRLEGDFAIHPRRLYYASGKRDDKELHYHSGELIF